jgi:anaerobic selenocysteine-containing dehydrogenase
MTSKESVIHTRVGGCPRDCPDGCSWLVDVDDQGRLSRLRGNPEHPFTRGSLCAKTNPYLQLLAQEDRLKVPMKRSGTKGSGRFEPITWEEAIDLMAQACQKAMTEEGPESIWPYWGTGSVGMIQGLGGGSQRLFHRMGASEHDANICSVAGHGGMRLTTGSAAGMDPEDAQHAGLILLWGTNTLVSNPHFWPFVRLGQQRGAKVVVIDPLPTKTAQKADLFCCIKPGTDGALALGLMEALRQRHAVDEDYLTDHSLGWQEFSQTVLPQFSRRMTLEQTGLAPDAFDLLVNWLSSQDPCAIRLGMGMQRHAGGGQAVRAISCLSAVRGDFLRLGGGICYSTGPLYPFNYARLQGRELRQKPSRLLTMTDLGKNLLELKDPPVKVLFVFGANPMVSNPQQNRLREGLMRSDLFTVVLDHFQTDTADFADLLLPSTSAFEHWDLHDSYSHTYVQLNRPVVSPLAQCRSLTEVCRTLARALDYEEPQLYATDEELIRDVLSTKGQGACIDQTLLFRQGWAPLPLERPFLPFARGCPTESGRFEFRSSLAAKEGHGWFPAFYPSLETTSGEGLVLISPAQTWTLNSIYANATYHQRLPHPMVTIHPKEAEKRHLSADQMVTVTNKRGAFQAILLLDDAMSEGVAMSPKGYWPKRGTGSTVNATIDDRHADLNRGACFHDNLVWIHR